LQIHSVAVLLPDATQSSEGGAGGLFTHQMVLPAIRIGIATAFNPRFNISIRYLYLVAASFSLHLHGRPAVRSDTEIVHRNLLTQHFLGCIIGRLFVCTHMTHREGTLVTLWEGLIYLTSRTDEGVAKALIWLENQPGTAGPRSSMPSAKPSLYRSKILREHLWFSDLNVHLILRKF